MEEFRQRAANTECYFLKIPDELLTNGKIPVNVTMSDAWNELLNQRYQSEYQRNLGSERDKVLYAVRKEITRDELRTQIDRSIFEALRTIFFDRLGLPVEVGYDFHGYPKDKIIGNNELATLKYKIIDGSSRVAVKFIDHETCLYLRFMGKLSGPLGPDNCVFEIAKDHIYLTNKTDCGVNMPWYL